MKSVVSLGWKTGTAVVVAFVMLVTACGQSATPTVAPTKAPAETTAPAATATVAKATPTTVPTATPQKPVYGSFRTDPNKILAIEYPYNKPDFSTTPKPGGVLKEAHNSAWPHLDVTVNTAPAAVPAVAPVYSKLVVCRNTVEMARADSNGCEIGPQLAKSWEVSNNGKVWTFHLVQGIKWQNLPPVNGRDLTADDIKWSYEKFQQGGPSKDPFSVVDKIEATDKYTVQITLKTPFAMFLEEGPAGVYAYIVPHEIADKDGDFKNAAVGSGPFQISQITGKERIVYQKNPNYFVPGAPLMSGMELLIIADPQAIRAAYRSGQIHRPSSADILSVAEMNALQKSNPDTIFEVVDNNFAIWDLFTRFDKAPFNDIRVRRAISLAIDRQGIIKDILENSGSILAPVPWNELFSAKPGIDQMPSYAYDPQKAKQLLADAGYANGFQMKIIYYPYAEVSRYIAVVLDNLKKVGIDAQLVQMDNASFNTAFKGRTYDQGALGYTLASPSMDGFTYGSMHSKGSSNYAFINDTEVDKLAEAQRIELDPAKRKALQQQLFAKEVDQLWRIPMPRPKKINYYSPKVHNYVYSLPMNVALHLSNNLDYIWVDP